MDKRSAVTLRVGEEHVVALPGLMGAGFLWEIADGGNGEVAEVRAEAADGGGTPGAPGAGPEARFSVRAVAAGSTAVRFVLRRPWQPEAPAGEVLVDVLVAG